MILNFILPILFVASFFGIGGSTKQIPDKIVIEGQVYPVENSPMESYFEDNPEKLLKTGAIHSGLWRGFLATFEFKNNQLALKSIEFVGSKKDASMRRLVPDGQTLIVDWFSGILIVPNGEEVWSECEYCRTKYSSYLLFELDSGRITQQKEFDLEGFKKFKERQFKRFKKSKQYLVVSESLKSTGRTDESADNIIRDEILSYTPRFLVD